MSIETTCCFTGHRPEKMPFSSSQYSFDYYEFTRKLEMAVQTAICSGYDHFITGMSRGMDLWVARIVLNFKRAYSGISLEAAIPFPGQDFGWNEEDRRIYQDIKSRCDKIHIISPVYEHGCMLARNRYMVDNSSLVIAAYLDGVQGGTKYTCDYAQKNGVRVINLFIK